MKKLNTYLKHVFLITALTFTAISCQKEEVTNTDNATINQKGIILKKVFKSTIDENFKLLEALNKIEGKRNSMESNARMEYYEDYGFFVDTESAIYIENEDKHSYTFSIFRQSDSVENLVISSQDDGSYNASIVSYNLTDEQITMLLIRTLQYEINKEDIYIEPLTDFDSSGLFGRSGDECIDVDTVQVNQCENADGDVINDNGESGNGCVRNWTTHVETVYNIDAGCLSSGGGGVGTTTGTGTTGTDTTGTDTTENGNQNNSGGGDGISDNNNNGNNTQGGFATLPYIDYAKHVAKTLGVAPTLPNAQADIYSWITNPDNIDIVEDIFSYIIENDYSLESKTFAHYAITILTINPNANPLYGADCRSFEFAQPPGALQKGCAVQNFNHTFYTGGFNSSGFPYYGEIESNIPVVYFTMPNWMTNSQAANLTAKAVTAAIKATDLFFFENPYASEYTVGNFFRNSLISGLAAYGGTISTTVEPFPISNPAPYINSVLGVSGDPYDC